MTDQNTPGAIFATSGAEDRWAEDTENACPHCGGSGHAGDVKPITLADALAVPEIAAMVDALKALHHAVCGETGFARCVRVDSGMAYPWPALDEADELTRSARAALAKEPKT